MTVTEPESPAAPKPPAAPPAAPVIATDEDAARMGCNLVSRRRFLVGLGAAVTVAACGMQGITVYQRNPSPGGSFALPGTSATPRPALPPGSIPATDRTLVVVELGGGNDSLSTVVPLTSRYRDLRPTTAIADPIVLDSDIGLHPNLAGVAGLYRDGRVAVVQGLGIDKPDLSHFVSMRRWWDGTDKPDFTGWLGRYLDAAVGYEQVLGGISVGPAPSPAMLGSASYVVGIADASGLASGFPWWVDDARDFAGVWSGFAPASVPLERLDPIRRAIATTALAQRQLQQSLVPLERALDKLEAGTTSLEGQLALAAALIASDVGPRVIFVHGHTDFDTHEDQVGRHGEMMAQLDRGIGHFFRILEAAGRTDRAVLMTTSEFGRRAADNDGGTDHGTAASHLVIGAGVTGGRYGELPDLRRLDPDGNLVHTVDFRSLYASVLDGWLKAPSEEILHGSFERLPIFG